MVETISFLLREKNIKKSKRHSYPNLINSQISIVFLSSVIDLIFITMSLHPIIDFPKLSKSFFERLTRIVIDKRFKSLFLVKQISFLNREKILYKSRLQKLRTSWLPKNCR